MHTGRTLYGRYIRTAGGDQKPRRCRQIFYDQSCAAIWKDNNTSCIVSLSAKRILCCPSGFQTFDNDKFENGNVFSAAFINSFLRSLKRNTLSPELEDAIKNILHSTDYTDKYFSLKELFEQLSDLCAAAEKKIVLMIDEVDSASNNQVFLDFLAQLRAQYIERDIQPTFRAVILAGVYDVKNLRRKIVRMKFINITVRGISQRILKWI